ncbi:MULTISPECIES: DUF357 domain-containing protein [Thermococcus]|uniref:DUF357 domain-containing protein n=4 Tax=Thermococcus TaxID=2263 RepID=A0A100XX92_9EURY|nr:MULTISPECIES: DUF357 domain-containing protein [Thermococcus]NJE01818.1 DUF357 domain-containing protein [Thermococcus sp. JdF3]KUH32815.1 hypothetical protein APY94_08500 [Thermococcus celericrescens]QDA31043.1 DUF357 domain-containing protein [Thermococcus indicus]QEK14478.1 DUF357 domain-containing protein [Thermococcus aciditolerans]CAD5243866.1 conserved protein of unknown function [Thermococcus camini]
MGREITEEKLQKYFRITEEALKTLEIAVHEKSLLRGVAEDFLTMARSYFNDARYYYERGDYVTAFAALNYAHGFIDAGVRLGVFRGEDDRLFAFG